MMKRFHYSILLFALIINSQFLFSQVPTDFLLIASAGGGEIWQDYSSLRIDAQGNGVFTIYRSKNIGSDELNKLNFTLTPEQMNDLWKAINENGFFALNSFYTHPSMIGRSFARLSIFANGTTGDVVTRNIAVTPFDNIIASINEKTPENIKLIYDISVPPVIVPKELCSAPGARILKSFSTKHKYAEDDRQNPDKTTALPSHPGTTLGCKMSLEEAVNKGLVELGSKGEFEGDAISIKVDNSTQQDCDRLTLNLGLEFYGENATNADALRIQNAIQEGWKGYKTEEGKDLDVLVDVRISPGAAEAPGTPGYHQIELVDDAARSYLDKVEEVNQGTGSGKWERNTDDEVYAHEAGHLMGLKDQYDDYHKLPDASWQKESNGEIITAEELAHRVDTEDPTSRTWEEILEKLNNPDFTTGSVPKPGHWDDVMGSTQGSAKATQQDINDLTADPGLIVEIPAGSTFLNESSLRQNMVSTRNEYMFTGNGETRQLDGIYATCIDGHKLVPRSARIFDLGPHISKWNGIESAPVLSKLINYIDKQNLFCEGTESVYAVWRLSDNFYVGDQYINDFFLAAGIEPGNNAYDFPKMTNTSFDGKTGNILPPELFLTKAAASPVLVKPGEQVNLSSSFYYPSIQDQITTSGEWLLVKPEGSLAALSDFNSENTTFSPDVRGIYSAGFEVTVEGLGSPIQAESKDAVVVAADEWTETFESGVLENNPVINWVTYGDAPWKISEFDPHSGKFCVESGAISDSQYTTLRINIVVPSDGEISFGYKVSAWTSDSLFLLIDDVVIKSWTFKEEWNIETIPISAGAHFVSWMYKKNGEDYGGLDKAWIDNILFPPNSVLTAVADDNIAAASYRLEQNYPNPFNPETEIAFFIPEAGRVSLKVYDMLGREAAELLNEDRKPGNHKVTFNASGLSSGVYFYRLTSGKSTAVKRMVLLR